MVMRLSSHRSDSKQIRIKIIKTIQGADSADIQTENLLLLYSSIFTVYSSHNVVSVAAREKLQNVAA